MTEDDDAPPEVATGAGPPSVWVDCPVCEVSKQFDADEMEEHDCGGWWSVGDPYRFDHCENCGSFVDYGAVGFQIHPPVAKPPKGCHFVFDGQGDKILIPGCYGAINDTGCTCDVPQSEIEKAQAEIDNLQGRLRWAMDRLEKRRHEAEDLRASNRHWWRVLRDHGIDPSKHNPPD